MLMKRVYKYVESGASGFFDLTSPEGTVFGQVVHFDAVGKDFVVWVEVIDVERSTFVDRKQLQVVGTGHPIPPTWHHIRSITVDGGRWIWHLYDGTKV